MYRNPKIIGSKIIDCVPLPGPCPNNCPDCFYNRPGAFYAPLDQPVLPSIEETIGKVVRVNSGGDSNVHKHDVIALTNCYKDRFFNTSIPDMDFPAPVVFTCNGKEMDTDFFRLEDVTNVMFVRVKTNSWNLELVDDVVRYYTSKHVPVVLTTMNYYTPSLVKRPEDYEWKIHVANPYWRLKDKVWLNIWQRYKGNSMVFSCGSPRSTFCKDCHNCYFLYMAKKISFSASSLRLLKSVQSINFDPIIAAGKNVFLICPVRGLTDDQKHNIELHIEKLKAEGKTVHWPPIDTDQNATSWDICRQNAKAILATDEVHIFWYKSSEGSKFDLGMVFMLNMIKGIMSMRVPLTVINPEALVSDTSSKSFEELLANWKHEVDDCYELG